MKSIAGKVLIFLFAISAVMTQAQVDSTQPQRGRGQRPDQAQPQQRPSGEGAQTPATQRALPEEKTVVTHHSGRIGNQQMNYTATTGTINVKAEDGTPKASFFYVAYT